MKMTTTTSRSPWPTPQAVRATRNECLTTYPPQWMPAILRSSVIESSSPAYTPAPLFALLARALLVGAAALGVAGTAFTAPDDRSGPDAATQPEHLRAVVAIVSEPVDPKSNDFAVAHEEFAPVVPCHFGDPLIAQFPFTKGAQAL